MSDILTWQEHKLLSSTVEKKASRRPYTPLDIVLRGRDPEAIQMKRGGVEITQPRLGHWIRFELPCIQYWDPEADDYGQTMHDPEVHVSYTSEDGPFELDPEYKIPKSRG